MVSAQMIEWLSEIGMTEREAKLYLALLDWPEASAAELQRISQVPRSKIYEVFEKMVSRGYCLERVENGRRYFRATEPSSLQKMLRTLWAHEMEHREEVANLVFKMLQEKYRQVRDRNGTLDKIEVIRSREQISRKYLSLIKETHKSLCSFNRSPYVCVDPKILEEQEKEAEKCLERGVKIRTIYMKEEEHWKWLYPSIVRSREQGEESRIANYLPSKMYISDNKKVMLALPSIAGQTEADFTMVIIEDEGVCESYRMLFENVWVSSLEPEAFTV